jgi:hypothetical protein
MFHFWCGTQNRQRLATHKRQCTEALAIEVQGPDDRSGAMESVKESVGIWTKLGTTNEQSQNAAAVTCSGLYRI